MFRHFLPFSGLIFVLTTLPACDRPGSESTGELIRGTSNVAALPSATTPEGLTAEDWPTWRGPNANGIAVDQKPLTKWTEDHVLWETPVPGRGHSSPTIIHGRIFLTTADAKAQTQSLLCFDQTSGEKLWERTVHSGKLTKRIHNSNSHASPSVASDGKNIFCVFVNDGQTQISKYDLDGKQLWQKALGKFQCDYGFGFGASPIYWHGKLIVSSECALDPFVTAIDPETGDPYWHTMDTFTDSPIPESATAGTANRGKRCGNNEWSRK